MGLPAVRPPSGGSPEARETALRSIRDLRIDRGRSYMDLPNGQVVLWDLDLATWIVTRAGGQGVDLVGIWREGNEFRIVFLDPTQRIPQLHIDFCNSECGRFAANMKMIKKAAHSIGQRPR